MLLRIAKIIRTMIDIRKFPVEFFLKDRVKKWIIAVSVFLHNINRIYSLS